MRSDFPLNNDVPCVLDYKPLLLYGSMALLSWHISINLLNYLLHEVHCFCFVLFAAVSARLLIM